MAAAGMIVVDPLTCDQRLLTVAVQLQTSDGFEARVVVHFHTDLCGDVAREPECAAAAHVAVAFR